MSYPNLDRYTRHAGQNYNRLSPFISAVDALEDRHFTFHANGYEPLSLEYLRYSWQGLPVYGMMHYYIQNGDLMRDPDITFAVDHAGRRIIPLTFQQDGVSFTDYGSVYQCVFPEPDEFSPKLLSDLDRFLARWTRNIAVQGFSPDEPQPAMSLEEFAEKHANIV